MFILGISSIFSKNTISLYYLFSDQNRNIINHCQCSLSIPNGKCFYTVTCSYCSNAFPSHSSWIL